MCLFFWCLNRPRKSWQKLVISSVVKLFSRIPNGFWLNHGFRVVLWCFVQKVVFHRGGMRGGEHNDPSEILDQTVGGCRPHCQFPGDGWPGPGGGCASALNTFYAFLLKFVFFLGPPFLAPLRQPKGYLWNTMPFQGGSPVKFGPETRPHPHGVAKRGYERLRLIF